MTYMPMIGILARKDVFGASNVPVQLFPQACVDAVLAAGGAPLVVPTEVSREAMQEAYAPLDGLLLPGGPQRVRNESEMALVSQALRDGLPVLGLCRGLQLLNVSAGGTHDRTEKLVAAALHHDNMGTLEMYGTLSHEITLEPSSRLARITGRATLGVNSGHGWACGVVAPGFRVVARAPDGIIEALEADQGFALGVQFHPEYLVGQEEWALPIFRAFIEAARD